MSDGTLARGLARSMCAVGELGRFPLGTELTPVRDGCDWRDMIQ